MIVTSSWGFKNYTFSQSFKIVHKIRKELEKENDNVTSVSKCKKHSMCSDSMRTPEFIHKVKQTMKNEVNCKKVTRV